MHQEERPQPAKKSSREEGGGDRGSTAARLKLEGETEKDHSMPREKGQYSIWRELF